MEKTTFTKDNLTIETTVPREAARLRSEGFTEAQPAVQAAEAVEGQAPAAQPQAAAAQTPAAKAPSVRPSTPAAAPAAPAADGK